MIGWDGRRVTLLMREFDKPLGLAVRGSQLALATRHEVTLFADAPLLAPHYLPDEPGRYDALYLPRITFHTGDLNTHDVAFVGGPQAAGSGQAPNSTLPTAHCPLPTDLLLVNTRFSCLARLSDQYHFVPSWRPPFVTDLVPEDRCHLNGVAMVEGRPKYVTALGTTDVPGGWRANKAAGGVVIDCDSGQVICTGLSMPHSPRWHQNRLWLLNSGSGELLVLDPATGRPDVVCALSGYLRGLCFVGRHAVVGLCKIREKHIFGGLPVQQRCERLSCGLAVIDLARGVQTGMFEFTSGCEELYDVDFLPGVRRGMILNLKRPELYQATTNPECAFWLRASEEIPPGGAGETANESHFADQMTLLE
jgi:hypothetical protein